jgi:hypothetical protein
MAAASEIGQERPGQLVLMLISREKSRLQSMELDITRQGRYKQLQHNNKSGNRGGGDKL